MKRTAKLRTQAITLYAVTGVLFLLFFLFMGVFENISVHKTRQPREYSAFMDYTVEDIADETAPIGIRRVYRWIMPESGHNENCLSFYTVHQYAEVYYDNELMFSLMPAENNLLGKSIGSNWVNVPVYPSDSGREITVIITPVYKSAAERDTEFLIGSHYTVFYNYLKADFPTLFLSNICILLGVFISVMQIYLRHKKRKVTVDIFFLGNFSVLLGIWRLTDTRTSTVLFSENPMVLGYIAIGSLCLCCIPLLLFMKARFSDFDAAPLLHVSIFVSCAALIILLCQLFGIADFRETLPLCHVMLAVTTVTVLVSAVIRMRKMRDSHSKHSVHYSILLAIGVVLDFVRYYDTGSSDGIIYTMIAFIIYAVILFATNVVETSTKAYTDPHTGLFNKSRWDELMQQRTPDTGTTGIMMLDLNRLKHTNDTQGHEAGDRMIFNFSNILRNTLPPSSLICRWGGDEFAVMITDTSRQKMENNVAALRCAVEEYNQSGKTPTIHFAVGFALSDEHPELNKAELLSEADDQMYMDKKHWYAENLRMVL